MMKLDRVSDTMALDAGKWLECEADKVRQASIDALRYHCGSEAHSDLLELLLRDAFDRLGVCHLACRLPLIVASGVQSEVSLEVHQLAAALTILEAGIYTLDHIMDLEVDGPIAAVPSAQLMLGSVSLVCHIPYQILSNIPTSNAHGHTLVAMLSDGLACMAAGQLADISTKPDDDADWGAIASSVEKKTGERRALYAALAAQHAGASAQQIEAYRTYGRSLGVARQIRSDLLDLFGSQPSRDLSNGTRTLPIALFFEKARDSERQEMRGLLSHAKNDITTHDTIRSRLRSKGILRDVVRLIETNCRNALSQIEWLQPQESAAALMRDLVKRASIVTP